MSKLPVLSGRKVVKILAKIGFKVHHKRGSHIVLKLNKPPYTRIVVPDHKEIKKGLLVAIIKQAGLTKEEFMKLMEKE
jgi:predicted RNA binding protein YcfA (HicA-like mRNA interferase family)